MRIALLLSGFVAAGMASIAAQAPVPASVPDALRAHVQNERFQVVTSVRGLPLGVRDELQALFRQQLLSIADPGERFQATDNITDPLLPGRRLIRAACSPDHCLVHYERGGIAAAWFAVLFHWTPGKTSVVAGGGAPAGLATAEAVRDALLTGKVTAALRGW